MNNNRRFRLKTVLHVINMIQTEHSVLHYQTVLHAMPQKSAHGLHTTKCTYRFRTTPHATSVIAL